MTTYAERKGISLNSAVWLLVQRGLEAEGVALPSAPPDSAGKRRRR